jgi:cytochrome c
MSNLKRRILLIGAVTGIATLAACGGGGEGEQKKPAGTTTAGKGNEQGGAGGAGKAAPAADDTATLSGATLAQFTGDATKGEAVFAQCRTCHVTEAGQNRQGPSLHGIVGRRAGTVEGYTYTPANRDSGITWSPEKLFQYLENPQRVVPGTKMIFPGIPDPQRRADLIAWLATQS